MSREKFRGLFPAQIVPFSTDGGINESSLRRLVQLNMSKGVKGFYVCGSTGESFLMTIEERKQVLEIVKSEVGTTCTVIAHVGTISTDQSIDLARHAESVGADAISAVAPFYYKFTPREVLAHYLAIVGAVELPMIVYNFPATSGVALSMDDLKTLFSEPKIIGIKHTSQDLYQLEQIKRLDSDIVVLFGFDEMSLGAYAMGADGGIGSTYNLMPEKYLKIRSLFEQQRNAEALEVQRTANLVIGAMLRVGIYGAIKHGITRKGIDFGLPRRPFLPLSDQDKSFLDKTFDRYL